MDSDTLVYKRGWWWTTLLVIKAGWNLIRAFWMMSPALSGEKKWPLHSVILEKAVMLAAVKLNIDFVFGTSLNVLCTSVVKTIVSIVWSSHRSCYTKCLCWWKKIPADCCKIPNAEMTVKKTKQNVRNKKVCGTECTRMSRPHKNSLSGQWLNLEETTKQLKQKPGCSRRKDEKRVQLGKNTGMGEDGFSFRGASLFILYSICILLQLGACVGRERLKKKKRK